MPKISPSPSWTQPAGSPATRSRADNEWEKAKGFLELQISDARYALYGTADRKEMEKFIESEQARVLPEHDKDRLAARNRRVFLAAKGCSSLNDAARVQLQQIHAISELIR